MTVSERILLVESDPDICELIARQALQPQGYQVNVVNDAANAIHQAMQYMPDLVITNLNLPGLSGKDLLVALTSQGIQAPVILIAEKGQEPSIIQAFRLGATDCLFWPVGEAEIVSVVERALKQVRETHTRQQIDRRWEETHQELEQRVRELTNILAVGRAIISISDERVLFEKIVEGTIYIAKADYGWFLLRDERTYKFVLVSQHNLPDSWAKKMNQPLDDGISSLVALSGEMRAINGESIKRFKVASLGQSAAVVPVKIQHEVIGLMVVVRKTNLPFGRSTQTLLEAVADYTSIAMVNARLLRTLQETADVAQPGEKSKHEYLVALRQKVQSDLQPVIYRMDLMLAGKIGPVTDEQQQVLKTMQAEIQQVLQTVTADSPFQPDPQGVQEK